MLVLSGRVTFTKGNQTVIATPETGTLHIPKTIVHGFKLFKGEPTVFKERTDPPGDFKEDFFTALCDTETGQPSFVTAARSFCDGDTFIATGGPLVVDRVVTSILGGVVRWMYPPKKA